MKRTDLERKEREYKRKMKKEQMLSDKLSSKTEDNKTPAFYIRTLKETFRYDNEKIYNLLDDKVIELLLDMKKNIPSNKFDGVLRKAIKATEIIEREAAFQELLLLLND